MEYTRVTYKRVTTEVREMTFKDQGGRGGGGVNTCSHAVIMNDVISTGKNVTHFLPVKMASFIPQRHKAMFYLFYKMSYDRKNTILLS